MIALYLMLRVTVWCIEVSIKVTFWILAWIITLIQMFCEYLIEQKEAKEHGPHKTSSARNETREAREEEAEPTQQAFYSNRR